MRTTIKLITIIAIALTLFSSCYDDIIITGNNQITEETRQIPAFEQIYSAGSFNIFYTHADTVGIRIVCESNLLPYIQTSVFNKKLDISFATHISVSLHQDIDIYVSSPAVEKIHLAGSGNIVADSLLGNDVEIMLSGSGNIYSNFYGDYLESSVSGSGKIEIYGECDTLDTSVSGSGTIELEAPNCSLAKVTISGSGKAELTGSADEAVLKILGSGKIKAYEFPVEKADVLIGGSGSIYVNASEYLDAVISGSGNIYYIGNPRINYTESGSGRLINEN
jgi:hypothetical protein